jgi:adenylate cyclase
MNRTATSVLWILAIALAATLVALAARQLRVARDLEAVTVDLRQLAFAPPTQPSPDIVMVWLDEPTMQSLPYRSPIPRNFLAELHAALMKAQPRLVAYDIFFKDPSFPKDDRALAAALHGTKAYAIVPRREGNAVDMPLPLFFESLAGVGLADLPFNPFDATVRRARLSYETDRGPMPTFAAALSAAATGEPAEEAVRRASAAGFGSLVTTPFADDDEILIRFAGPPGKIGGRDNAFKTYSASLVATGFVPEEWLQDKIVLVGAASADLKDAYLTPYYAKATKYARMNGVEIHANILSSLLTGQLYDVLRPWQALAWTFLAALLVAAASVPLTPGRAAPLAVLAMIAFAAAAVALFRTSAVVAPIVAPLIAGGCSFVGSLALRALTEGRQKRFIKSVFARYVPAAVVTRMTEHPELLRLGGETRQVTSLFTDIASFTSISERMDPAQLVAFLNDYLGRMNEILFREGATLDKYEGDAIIAFFNAPLDLPGHEAAALRAALGIREASARVSKDWKQECGREIVTRVGIAAGPAVVGNMGSEGRFDYTAIGDTINLASRLEGANKFYGTTILASEAVIANTLCASSFVTRPVDRVRVKGKREPILLSDVVGESGRIDREIVETLVVPYREAFERFEARKIDEARALLAKVVERHPEDGPARDLVRRCERAAVEPAWDLVTELTSK